MVSNMTSSHDILFLNRSMIEDLPVDTGEILSAVSQGVIAQAEGGVVLEPTVWLSPYDDGSGFATIRGAIPGQNLAGIKNVGTFQDNHKKGLPGDVGLMTLFDAQTGVPTAILDGSPITTIRTAAMTALGAKHLARPDSRILGYIGVRGIAARAITFIDSLFDLDEIRIFSASEDSRSRAAVSLNETCRANVIATDSWEECLKGADILVDGSSLRRNEVLFSSAFVSAGATVIAYGGYSSFDMRIIDSTDKIVMDRWQDFTPGMIGALAPQMEADLLTEKQLHSLLCDILTGVRKGRESEMEKILFWHRGLASCDITLANLYLEKAAQAGAGISLPYL